MYRKAAKTMEDRPYPMKWERRDWTKDKDGDATVVWVLYAFAMLLGPALTAGATCIMFIDWEWSAHMTRAVVLSIILSGIYTFTSYKRVEVKE